jgi:hypothetical protein
MGNLPILAEKDARRVIASAALMTSDKDGEALAAVRATCRLLAPHNIGPADIFRAALVEPDERSRRRDTPPPRPEPFRTHNSRYSGTMQRQHVQLARTCLAWREHLTEWEIGFLNSIMGTVNLSTKQSDRLQQIARTVEMKRWEAGNDGSF